MELNTVSIFRYGHSPLIFFFACTDPKCFGVWIRFVYTICALHDFINGHRTDADKYFRRAQRLFEKDQSKHSHQRQWDVDGQASNERGTNDGPRRDMARDLWREYCQVMKKRG